jgi:hypothetical protein
VGSEAVGFEAVGADRRAAARRAAVRRVACAARESAGRSAGRRGAALRLPAAGGRDRAGLRGRVPGSDRELRRRRLSLGGSTGSLLICGVAAGSHSAHRQDTEHHGGPCARNNYGYQKHAHRSSLKSTLTEVITSIFSTVLLPNPSVLPPQVVQMSIRLRIASDIPAPISRITIARARSCKRTPTFRPASAGSVTG